MNFKFLAALCPNGFHTPKSDRRDFDHQIEPIRLRGLRCLGLCWLIRDNWSVDVDRIELEHHLCHGVHQPQLGGFPVLPPLPP